MRLYRYTTNYPRYDHTSFNASFERGRWEATFSLHVKYAWTWSVRGFWFGLRPEFDIRRASDRSMEVREMAREAQVEHTCCRCGTREYGPPGMRRPEGWEFIYTMDFCNECVSKYTYRELLSPEWLER